MYSVDNEVVNDLRRHTRAYVKKIGGLPIISALPRREYQKKDSPILEDAVLVEDFEELVEIIFRSKYIAQKTHAALMKGLCALKK